MRPKYFLQSQLTEDAKISLSKIEIKLQRTRALFQKISNHYTRVLSGFKTIQYFRKENPLIMKLKQNSI